MDLKRMQVVILLGTCVAGRDLWAQETVSAHEVQLADRGPRFLSTPSDGSAPIDVSNAPVLLRRVTMELVQVPLGDALRAVGRQAGVRFSYSPTEVSTEHPVSVSATNITLAGALHEMLVGTELDVQLSSKGLLWLVPRASASLHTARRQGGRTIAGRVTDAKTTQGLPGATVAVAATNSRARTDATGQYTITGLGAGRYAVTARLLGYAPSTQPVVVGADSVAHADFALAQAAASLEQVVVTGAGLQRRIELGNAIATINADSVVRTAAVTSLTDVISGRAPGVDVVQTNGMAGSGPAIRIRGRGSVTLPNDPIYIIDGVRMDGSPGGTVDAFALTVGVSNNPTNSRLNDVDPNEIETIEVLRGPSASTEYGTDAANGVVVITTKRGRAGAPHWSATAEEGLSTMPVHFPDNYYSWGHTTDGAHTSVMCPLIPNLLFAQFFPSYGFGSVVGTCAVDSVTRWQPLNHYETSLFGTGTRGHYELQVSGGAGQTSYFLGGGLTSEIGAIQMPNTEAARLVRERGQTVPRDQLRPNALDDKNVRARIATALGDAADIMATATYVNNTQRSPHENNLLLNALVAAGIRDSLSGYFSGLPGFYVNFVPGTVLSNTGTEGVSRFTGGLSSTVRPTAWLTGRATTGLDNASTADQLLTLPGQGFSTCTNQACTGFGQAGYRSVGLYRTDLYTVDLGATAAAALTRVVSSKTTIGMQYNDRRTSGSAIAVAGLALGNPTLNGAAELSQLERGEEATTLGSYVEETIGLAERLFVVGAIRVDAGSGFGKSYKAAAYPKASASWVVLPEGGQASLRLRAAYGQSGVQPPAGSAIQLYAPTETFSASGSVPSAVLATIGTPGLRPERTAEEEGGFDLGLFHQRLTLEATAYNKLSRDALVGIPIEGSLGAGTQLINLGSVRNRGIEMLLTARVLDTRPVQWDVTLSGSDNENRLVTLGRGVNPIDQTSLFEAPYKQVPGFPLYGAWANPLIHYSDLNHDGIIEANEVTVGAAPSFIGPTLAPRELAINSGVTLLGGRIRVDGQIDHRSGQYLTNTLADFTNSFEHSRATNNPHAPVPEQARAVATISSGYVDIEPASFTRLRELSLTYVASTRLAAALRVRALSFTLAGRNLALWTRYTGSDPEVSTVQGANQVTTFAGVPTGSLNPDIVGDFGSVPQMRYWTLKVNAGL